MMDDAMKIVCPDGEMPDVKKKLDVDPKDYGSFELLYDEATVAAVGARGCARV